MIRPARWLIAVGLAGLGLGLGQPVLAALDAGTEPALYLGGGARNLALGRCGVTETQSAFAADWNPAGVGFIPHMTLGVQHALLFSGATLENAAFALPTLDWGSTAIGLTRMDLGGIERRTTDNLSAGDFGLTEQQWTLSHARVLWEVLALGLTAKVHNLRLDGLESTSAGLDAGLLCRLKNPLGTGAEASWLKDVSLGAFMRNVVSPQLTLKQETDRLLPTYRAGASATLELLTDLPNHLLLRAELEKPEQAGWRVHAGAEFAIYDLVALRGGWDQEYFSAGAGVTWQGISLDYAVSFPEIGLRHLMTLSVAMGPDLSDLTAARKREEEKRRQQIVDNLKNSMVEDYRVQARALTQSGDYSGAVRLWQKVLDWDAADPEAGPNIKKLTQDILKQENAETLKVAQEHYAKERYVDAMVECRRILERDPDDAPAKALYQKAEKKATNLGELAFAYNVKALEKVRKSYTLGLKAYTERNWEAAIKHWEQVIADSPLQKQVYSYLDQARTRMKKETQEGQKTQKVSETEQKHQELYHRAVTLSKEGNLKEAVGTWETLVKENPKDEDLKRSYDKTRQDLIESQKKGIRW